MKKIILYIIMTLVTLCANAKKKEPNPNDGFFNFKNQTLVGAQIGWGPSFKCDGKAKDYTLEVWNATACLNYSQNGRYVIKGPYYGLNPSKFTWSFGYDCPVFTKERFQFSLNPMLGWEVDYYYSNAHHTKMGPMYKERSGPQFGIGGNFDVMIIEKMNGRFGVKYINNTVDFSIGINVRK